MAALLAGVESAALRVEAGRPHTPDPLFGLFGA